MNCAGCPLQGRPHVGGHGPLAQQSLILVGDHPGNEEANQGVPFVGDAGEELRQALAASDARLEDYYVTNAVKCVPPARMPKKALEEARRHCLPELERELRLLQPKVVLTLGKTAMKSCRVSGGLVGGKTGQRGNNLPAHAVVLPDKALGFEAVRAWVFPTVNPAFLLPGRSPRFRWPFTVDVDRAVRALRTGALRWSEGELCLEPTVKDLEHFEKRLKKVKPKYVAFDIETQGRGHLAPLTCCGVGFRDPEAEGGFRVVVVPFRVWKDGAASRTAYWQNGDGSKASAFLQRIFDGVRVRNRALRYALVAHNGQYDTANLETHGFRVAASFLERGVDTMGLQHNIASELPMGLGFACSVLLDSPIWKGMVDHGDKVRDAAWELNYRKYNALDVRNTVELVEKQLAMLEQYQQQRPEIDFARLRSVFMVSQEASRETTMNGLRVDQQRVQQHLDEYEPRLRSAAESFREVTGAEPSNPGQVGRWFYKVKDCEVVFRTEQGAPATHKKARALWAKHPDQEVRDAANLLSKHKALAKIVDVYLRGFQGMDTYYPSFNVAGTVSLRWSEKLFQTIPQRLRNIFCARPGHVLVDADYKQLEQRLLAYLADEQHLIHDCENGDPHTMVCKRLFGLNDAAWETLVKADKVGAKRKRTFTKRFWYGRIQYLASDDNILRALRDDYDEEAQCYPYADLTLAHIIKMNVKLNREYPMIEKFTRWWWEEVQRVGYAYTFGLRRPRWMLDGLTEEHRRAAINFPIQGTGSDIVAEALRLVRSTLPGTLRINLHDALVLEVPIKQAKRAAATLTRCMEHEVALQGPWAAYNVRFPVDCEVKERWG